MIQKRNMVIQSSPLNISCHKFEQWPIDPLHREKEDCIVSASGKFVMENKSITPALGISTASCDEKLLQNTEHFSASLLSTNLHKVS